MRFFLLLMMVFVAPLSYSQNNRIDTIPFTLDKSLLVFTGKVNGVATDFAFDTGAGISVSNSTQNSTAGIKISGGNRTVKDANQNVEKISKILIDDLQIGSYHINNLKAVTTDMSLLYCANLLLLGQDVIKKYNWKIDFAKQQLYVSASPFITAGNTDSFKVTYKGNRPHIDFSINNKKYKNCLIDFGFTGILDINSSVTTATEIFTEKLNQHQANQYLMANMGLNGLSEPETKNRCIIDSMYFNNIIVYNIPAIISATADTKVGVGFFNSFCNSITLNHSTDTYYLEPSHKPFMQKAPLDVRAIMKDGKFFISDKNLTPGSSALSLEMGEEIKTLNGKTAADFKTDCDFILWKYFYKQNELTVEKINGTKVLVKRSQ